MVHVLKKCLVSYLFIKVTLYYIKSYNDEYTDKATQCNYGLFLDFIKPG